MNKDFILTNHNMSIEEVKNEVKIMKELRSEFILRYLEEYENNEFYLIFTEKCVTFHDLSIFVSFDYLREK